MASLLGEQVGDTVGYRMRLDVEISAKTRIEVVTEGVFARMILDDPELSGVSTVIFDEFHERSLDADFGLALALDVQSALREDMRILVMSATLDIERVAALLEHPPVIESMGRSFPIDIRHQDRPAGERIEDTVTRAILDAHATEQGSILAFLPGQAEITRTAERLENGWHFLAEHLGQRRDGHTTSGSPMRASAGATRRHSAFTREVTALRTVNARSTVDR